MGRAIVSAVTWTPTSYFQWMKRAPPVGTTLPTGEYTMVLQQWFVSSDGQGEWQQLPVRHWNEIYQNPPTTL
jgi:hypothetical protein